MEHVPQILFVLCVAVLAPMLASRTGALRIPVVVFEILLGAAIGPQGLGLVSYSGSLPYLATMGMAFLFFLAGTEIELGTLKGKPLALGIASWVISLLLAGGFAMSLASAGLVTHWPLVAIALATTALGIVVPILRDVDVLQTPLGRMTMACGAMGEIGPILIMSLLFAQGHGYGIQMLLVGAFILVVVGVFWASLRVRPPGLIGLLSRTMTQSGQLPIRVSLLLIAALVTLAELFGLDLALGAFAAGMAVGLAVREEHPEVLHHKYDAVGFGFLVPIFFIVSGLQLDVRALLAQPRNLLLMLLYAVALLVIRGLPAVLFRGQLSRRDVAALGLYSATSLSLIVALTHSAVTAGMMSGESAAALVGGGLISVLVFPVIATRLLGKRVPSTSSRGEAVY
ncbi:cation:proton antiporter [Niveibacterium sp. SC-1]|uniref:cation:proton antiporter n=1 Tax=Niveibacterium sp. SC-1 TaxID=3135646 RepID=UPI00311E5B73